MSVQDSIIKAINEAKVSQAELSRRSGVSKSSLSRYLGGDDIPASKLKAIADALHMTVDELFGINQEPSLSSDEHELVTLWRRMDQNQRQRILADMRDFALANDAKKEGDGRVEKIGTLDAVR